MDGAGDSGEERGTGGVCVVESSRRAGDCRKATGVIISVVDEVFENAGIITNQNAGDWTPAGWASRNDLASAARKSS